jgi:glycosyltransferase involved in cell wall biosynthesis
VDGANGILVGSEHVADRLRQAVDDPVTNAKVRLGPPGVDTSLFAPIPFNERRQALRRGAQALRDKPPVAEGGGTAWDTDPKAAADALDWYADAPGPRVIFVGKLIVSKGVDLLLAAWPLVLREHPDARLLIVGFGALEDALRAVVDGFSRGDLEPLRELAERGRGLEGADDQRLEMLSAFLENASDGYAETLAAAGDSIRFAGRLEHDEVAAPVSCSDVLVFPSTFPEAFGMVAAEAAAAGVGTVSARHSGAAEVSDALAADLPEGQRYLVVSFDLDDRAVTELADRVDGWLALESGDRELAGGALRGTVRRLWSWEQVAQGVIDASAD